MIDVQTDKLVWLCILLFWIFVGSLIHIILHVRYVWFWLHIPFFSQVQGRVSTAASSNSQKTGVVFCQMHFSELSRESWCKRCDQSTVGINPSYTSKQFVTHIHIVPTHFIPWKVVVVVSAIIKGIYCNLWIHTFLPLFTQQPPKNYPKISPCGANLDLKK